MKTEILIGSLSGLNFAERSLSGPSCDSFGKLLLENGAQKKDNFLLSRNILLFTPGGEF